MNNLTITVLVAAFVSLLVGVVLYDQRSEPNDLSIRIEVVNPSSTDSTGVSVASPSQTSQQSDVPPSTADSSSQASTPQLKVPLPYEQGVVHLGVNAALGGKLPMPEDSPWNQPIDDAPVDPMSSVLIRSIGLDKPLHPAFGSGEWEGAPIGIPYVVVSGDQPQVPIVYTAYGDESDPGPYPIPAYVHIEGHPNQDGDRHVIVIDRDNWKAYELFRAFSIGDGQLWRADSGAIFDLHQRPSRPKGWTSADAAGLPIFPGLVRYDEVVELKGIRHALRFTVSKTRRAYVAPATHWASRSTDANLPPMGMRVRLKADYDISKFPPEAQVILRALKKYGMILADNGSDWYLSGAPHPLWDNDALHKLRDVKGKDFEVVLMEQITADQ